MTKITRVLKHACGNIGTYRFIIRNRSFFSSFNKKLPKIKKAKKLINTTSATAYKLTRFHHLYLIL